MNIKNFDIRQFVFWPTIVAVFTAIFLVALGFSAVIVIILAIGMLGVLVFILGSFIMQGYVVGTATFIIVVLFFLFLIFYDEVMGSLKFKRR